MRPPINAMANWPADISPSLLLAIFDNAPLVMMLVNGQCRVERVNHAGQAAFPNEYARTLGALGGQVLGCFNATDPECGRSNNCGQCPVRQAVVQTLATGAGADRLEGELCILDNGAPSTRWFLISTAAIDFDGERKVLLSLDDISDLKRLEHARDDAERILRHDLKTPLNGLIGLPQALLAEDGLTLAQRATLRFIEQSGKQMLRRIELSLDLCRMERGTFVFDPEPVIWNDLLYGMAMQCASEVSTRGALLDLRVGGKPLDASEALVTRSCGALCAAILHNLVQNAIEASRAGDTVSAHVTTSPDGADVELRVRNPAAVPPGIRDSFFEKYVTHGKKRGVGLGTYSAKLMVKTLGGSIAMRASEAEGTVVTVRLPRVSDRGPSSSSR